MKAAPTVEKAHSLVIDVQVAKNMFNRPHLDTN